ncbi:MAG: mechanosensitive ion channel domain-containing protein [Promethearchaeota archaeon]
MMTMINHVLQSNGVNEFLSALGTWNIGDWQIPVLGLIILIVSLSALIMIYKFILKIFRSRIESKGELPNVYNALKFFMRIIFLVIALILTTNLLQIAHEYILLITGLIITAISFGSLTSINNLIAGIYLSFTGSFRIGDYVNIDGLEGIITKISLNYTFIKHFDGSMTKIPNNKCLDSVVINYTLSVDWYKEQIKQLKTQILKLQNKLRKHKSNELKLNIQKFNDEIEDLQQQLSEITKVQNIFMKKIKKKKEKEKEIDEKIEKEEKELNISSKTKNENMEKRKSKEEIKKGAKIDLLKIDKQKFTYSMYADEDKIVKYSFTIKLPLNPKENEKALDKVCKKWAKEFEITPYYEYEALSNKIKYRIYLLTPDPYDIIKFRDAFLKDVWIELFSKKQS